MKRPKPFQVDQVRVRVHRGPDSEGRWYWRADTPDGAKRRTVWMGWATRDDAGKAVRVALEERPAPTGELRTVRDLLEAWVASQQARQDVSRSTQVACEEAGHRLVAHGLADVALAALDRRDIERHRDTALRAGMAGATVARDLKYLRQAWRWGTEIGEVALRLLPRVKVERVRPVYSRYTPTLEDVVGLLGGVSERVRRGIVLLAASGCRSGEISGLCWGQVALDGRRIRVDGKTGARVVELHSAVAAELVSWGRGAPNERVVGVSENTVRVALARRAEQLGIPRVSPNGLRRHVVDLLYRTGRIDAAAAQLGHSATTALSIYRQVTTEDRRRAVEEAEVGAVVALRGRRAPVPTSVPDEAKRR